MITEPAVVGRVHNLQNGKQIKLAKVQVIDTVFYGETDINGNYYLTPNLKEGCYKLQISAEGYETKMDNIDTFLGRTVTLNIGLQPILKTQGVATASAPPGNLSLYAMK